MQNRNQLAPMGQHPQQQNYPNNIQQPMQQNNMGQSGYIDSNQAQQQQGFSQQPNTNPLVLMATPLLTLITQVRHTSEHPNVPALRAQIIEEINKFEKKCSSISYPVRTITAARYCLCTAIDEAILGQSWGSQSIWVQESLLSLFHKETWGGERFYLIIEDMLRDMRKNIDFIEFGYFLLSLGFEGKFFNQENAAAREEIRNRIFYHIRHARMKPERILSPHGHNIEQPLSITEKKSKLKKYALTSLAIIVVFACFYNYKVESAATPTIAKLNKIATISPETSFSQVIQRPIIMRNMSE